MMDLPHSVSEQVALAGKDKLLFTPGPLTTSPTVKQAMLHDLGSRDPAFIEVVADVRRRLLSLAGVAETEYTAVLVQGSGTFGVEAMVSSVVPAEGKLLVLSNGAYGERILRMAEVHRIPALPLRFAEDRLPDPQALQRALEHDPTITHVAAIHCETTTGILNPIEAYGEIAIRHNRAFCVDAMSSFGAYPIDLEACGIDYLVSSSNKNIQGVPGFSFVLARKARLAECRGRARSLSLDLLAQWEGLENDGQFRFTPPTHALLAFQQALTELEAEGGVMARGARYQRNHAATVAAMQRLGFRTYLEPAVQSYIITSFHYPEHPRFDFREFYRRLGELGFVIYPGKLGNADCFRIGHIGHLGRPEVEGLMQAVDVTLRAMGVDLPEVER